MIVGLGSLSITGELDVEELEKWHDDNNNNDGDDEIEIEIKMKMENNKKKKKKKKKKTTKKKKKMRMEIEMEKNKMSSNDKTSDPFAHSFPAIDIKMMRSEVKQSKVK